MNKYGFLALICAAMPFIYGDTFESSFFDLFINNKTKNDVIIHFFNSDYEQQRYPMKPDEHRFVRVKKSTMRRLDFVRVTMKDPETKKLVVKDIDYTQNAGINRLKISMKPDLELRWGYESDSMDKDEDLY